MSRTTGPRRARVHIAQNRRRKAVKINQLIKPKPRTIHRNCACADLGAEPADIAAEPWTDDDTQIDRNLVRAERREPGGPEHPERRSVVAMGGDLTGHGGDPRRELGEVVGGAGAEAAAIRPLVEQAPDRSLEARSRDITAGAELSAGADVVGGPKGGRVQAPGASAGIRDDPCKCWLVGVEPQRDGVEEDPLQRMPVETKTTKNNNKKNKNNNICMGGIGTRGTRH